MITIGSITQQELEQLLEDSRQIAQDWNAYLQFQQNRDAILKQIMPTEAQN